MSICIVCKYQITDESVHACPNCGAPIEAEKVGDQATADSDTHPSGGNDDITESANQSPVESSQELTDSIEICDPGAFIGADDEDITEDSPDDTGQIGLTSSPLPPQVDDPSADIEHSSEDLSDTGRIRKLSPEQAAQIRSAFNAKPDENGQLTPEDASSIMNRMAADDESEPTDSQSDLDRMPLPSNQDQAAFKSGSSAGSKETDPESPDFQTSPALRRIAYFHKNFIQLTGPHYPRTGEELIIDDCHYLLKPKKIKQQHAIALFSVLLLILLFVAGSQFISPTVPGAGSVIGIVLDDEGRPYSSEITVTLPEAGKKATTNSIGFFRFADISTGTYVIRYEVPGGKIMTENISIVGDQATTISLGNDRTQPPEFTQRPVQTSSNKNSPAERKVQTKTTESAAPSKTASSPAVKKYASLKLKSNVDGSRLMASGQVLGVGNLTYKKLLPGKHKVKVSRDGYKAWNGTVTLKPDQTYNLVVNLEKIAKTAPAADPVYSAEDFYQSAMTQLDNGNYGAAIEDFTEALNMKPDMADAYMNRAKAYQFSGNNSSAEKDYVRAGEIFTGQKRYETAHQVLGEAISINKKSVTAHLIRARLYLKQNDLDRAVKSYKSALKYDKKNFQANFELGKTYFSIHKNKYADNYLRAARDINPRTPEVYHYLMLNYFARDDFGKVKKTYTTFKDKMNQEQIANFKANPKFEPIIRVVGEYERP